MNHSLLEQKNLTSKLPFIYSQRCENCGMAKIECRRRVPFGDTSVFIRRGNQGAFGEGQCQNLVQIKSTRQLCDREMWQSLNQTRFDRPGDQKGPCNF